MSDETRLDQCILCEKEMKESENLRIVKAKAIENLCKASRARKDKKHITMQSKGEFQVHLNCYSTYTRDKNIASSLKEKSVSKVSKRKDSMDSEPFIFSDFCFLCGDNASDEYIRRRSAGNKIRKVTSEETISNIIEKLEGLESRDNHREIILSRLKNIDDILNLKPRYHTNCCHKFLNYSDFTRGRPQNDEISKAVNFVIHFLETNNEECQFSLKQILYNYDPNNSLNLQYIKDKVEELLSTEVCIYSVKHDYVICYVDMRNNILCKDWYASKLENEKMERLRIVEAAANIVLQDIRKQYYDCKNYPPPDEFLKGSEEQVPQSLKKFLDVLIKTNKKIKKGNEKWDNRVTTMSHSIISSVRPRSFLSPVLLGLSCIMHRNHASRFLIDSLSHIGLCASYDETLLFEGSIVCNRESKFRFENSYVQCVFDNADHNTNTFSGKDTFHQMGGLMCCTPSASVKICEKIDRLKKAPNTVSTIAASGKIPLINYTKPDTLGLKAILITSLKNYSDIDITPTDFLWFYSKKHDSNTPAWSGFMEECTEPGNFDISKMIPLPFVNNPPSNTSTILSVLLEANRIRKAFKQHHIFVTFDQPLFQKGREIVEHSKGTDNDLSSVIVRLGGFHALMSYLGSIGYIMKGSGLKEAFSVMFAEGLAEQALTGKSYSRAVKGHISVQYALAELLLDNLHLDDEEKQFLHNLLSRQGEDDFYSKLKTDELLNIKEKFKYLLMTTKKNGPTAQLWIQYFFMIEILKQFTQAERIGDWESHLRYLELMLPFFHASGHTLYAKSAHLYLQDMYELRNIMDPEEYQKYVIAGYFTMRRTNKFRSGIWSDMTIEQVLMRLIQGPKGFTRNRGPHERTVSTWVDTSLPLYEVNAAMESFCNVSFISSEQHVDLQKCHIIRDAECTKLLVQFFKNHDPFPVTDKILSISTGIVGDSKINCYQAFQIGKESIEKIIGKDFGSVKFERKTRVLPLSTVTSSIKIDDEIVPINATLVFQRISLNVSSQNDMKNYLQYELAPYPTSLFDESGMLKTKKSAFYENFNRITFDKERKLCFIIDGGMLLHKVVWPEKEKISNIIEKYVVYVKSHYDGDRTVIFDDYPEQVDVRYTKSGERLRRQNILSGTEIYFDMNTKILATQQAFLSNGKNKRNFIKLLCKVLNGEGCITNVAPEDADTLIVETALKSSEADNDVVVVGEDIDLLVILNQRAANDKITFFKPARSGGADEFFTSKSFKITKLQKYVAFIHAFTGCDTTSSFKKQGKQKILKTLEMYTDLLPLVDNFYDCNATSSKIIASGVKIIARMYATKFENQNDKITLNDIRFKHFQSSTKRGSFNLEYLPPSESAAAQHCLRVYHQVQSWLGNLKDATCWGWKITTNGLQPILSSEPLIPDNILKVISCGCKSGCKSKSCSCKKHGLECTHMCSGCHGQDCSNITEQSINIAEVIANERDEDEGISNIEEDLTNDENFEEPVEEDVDREEEREDVDRAEEKEYEEGEVEEINLYKRRRIDE